MESDMPEKERKPYIICGGETGRAVVFGWLDDDPVPGQPVIMYDAQMVLYWSEQCGGLFGLAANGPKTGTRITAPVSRVTDQNCKQSLAVSEAAVKQFAAWRYV